MSSQETGLLFLGSIDLAGIISLSVNDGNLVLAAGPYRDIRDNVTYTCSAETETGTINLVTYHVTLQGKGMLDDNCMFKHNV